METTPQSIGCELFFGRYRTRGIANDVIKRVIFGPSSEMICSRSDFAAGTSVALPFPLTLTTGSFLVVYGA
ncbi:hypothetical protein Tco_0229513, partial [Tanacetum coccineum]